LAISFPAIKKVLIHQQFSELVFGEKRHIVNTVLIPKNPRTVHLLDKYIARELENKGFAIN
jgi:hypothetical protein